MYLTTTVSITQRDFCGSQFLHFKWIFLFPFGLSLTMCVCVWVLFLVFEKKISFDSLAFIEIAAKHWKKKNELESNSRIHDFNFDLEREHTTIYILFYMRFRWNGQRNRSVGIHYIIMEGKSKRKDKSRSMLFSLFSIYFFFFFCCCCSFHFAFVAAAVVIQSYIRVRSFVVVVFVV